MKTINLETLVRKNILALKPYSSARDEYSDSNGVFLDANENPFGTINRYPDPYQKLLKNILAKIKDVNASQIFIGNGSDEAIDLLLRLFCEPNKDKVLIFPPTYGMYEVSANINNIGLIKIDLSTDFQLNIDEILNIIETDKSIKMIFICSPNNPTGNKIDNIEIILKKFDGIVVVDEAYIDFCPNFSLKEKINIYNNLVVIQTFSKAWGLAGARVGIALANTKIIDLLSKIKSPYNVSILNQQVAIDALFNQNEFEKQRNIILQQREFIENELKKFEIVKKIYPSDTNFVLVKFENANKVYNKLLEKHIVTRNRHSQIVNCIRITIGSPEENKSLLNSLIEINRNW